MRHDLVFEQRDEAAGRSLILGLVLGGCQQRHPLALLVLLDQIVAHHPLTFVCSSGRAPIGQASQSAHHLLPRELAVTIHV
jgi:hypothetical protein